MRNQKRTLAILLAVLAVLILLILFVIPNLGGSAPIQEAETRIPLCTLGRSDIRQLTYTTVDSSRTLSLVNDAWVYEDGTAENQDTVSNMLSAVSGLYSTQMAYDGQEYLSQCGLDAPTLIVTASGTAGSVTVTVGGYNNALDRWYCTVDGGTEIYLIGNNLPTRFGIKK